MNALFNKGAHPRPSLFEESNVRTFENIKTIGKTKKQNNRRGQVKHLSKPSRKPKTIKNNTFRSMSAKVDMGLKGLFCFCLFVVSVIFNFCCIDLFGCFGFFGFPDGF